VMDSMHSNRDDSDDLTTRARELHDVLQNDGCNQDKAFYAAYVCSRPLDNAAGQVLGFPHWGLFLVGQHHLARIEFWGGKNGKVTVQVFRHTLRALRCFWYQWDSNTSNQFFTQRWDVISSFYLQSPWTSAERIGLAVEVRFLQNPNYSPGCNNCQHFVRDLVMLFNAKIGKLLNIELTDRRIDASMPFIGLFQAYWNDHYCQPRAQQLRQFISDEFRQRHARAHNIQDDPNDIPDDSDIFDF